MDIILFVIVFFLLFVGIIGSFLPFIPGPPISLIGLYLLHFFSPIQFSLLDILSITLAVIIVFFLDFWLQIYSVELKGGGKMSKRGVMLGLILGFFLFPPFGIVTVSFLGAYIGARCEGNNYSTAFHIALGSFLGFLGGSVIKLFLSLYIFYKIIIVFI